MMLVSPFSGFIFSSVGPYSNEKPIPRGNMEPIYHHMVANANIRNYLPGLSKLTDDLMCHQSHCLSIPTNISLDISKFDGKPR